VRNARCRGYWMPPRSLRLAKEPKRAPRPPTVCWRRLRREEALRATRRAIAGSCAARTHRTRPQPRCSSRLPRSVDCLWSPDGFAADRKLRLYRGLGTRRSLHAGALPRRMRSLIPMQPREPACLGCRCRFSCAGQAMRVSRRSSRAFAEQDYSYGPEENQQIEQQ